MEDKEKIKKEDVELSQTEESIEEFDEPNDAGVESNLWHRAPRNRKVLFYFSRCVRRTRTYAHRSGRYINTGPCGIHTNTVFMGCSFSVLTNVKKA